MTSGSGGGVGVKVGKGVGGTAVDVRVGFGAGLQDTKPAVTRQLAISKRDRDRKLDFRDIGNMFWSVHSNSHPPIRGATTNVSLTIAF